NTWKHRIASILRQGPVLRRTGGATYGYITNRTWMTRSTLIRTLLVGGIAATVGTAAVTVPLLASAATTAYQAESATISQAVVATNHAGFTGTGFVDYNNVAGG